MTVIPEGLNYEIDIGGEQPLMTRRANSKSFKLYNLRLLPFLILFPTIMTIVLALDGEWYFGLGFFAIVLAFALYFYLSPNLPKVSYYITTGRIGIANKTSWGYYEYRDVRKAILRPKSHSITLRGPGSAPVKIDLYLSVEDYEWFVAEILPLLPNAAVTGKRPSAQPNQSPSQAQDHAVAPELAPDPSTQSDAPLADASENPTSPIDAADGE